MERKADIENYIAFENMSVIDAMKKIDNNAQGILYVINKEEQLIGSLTDGDIRRWLIRTADLSASISNIAFKDTKYLFQHEKSKCNELMRENKINSVPIIDKKFRIIEIIFENYYAKNDECDNKSLKGISVIIMAGGKGTRLYPFTHILPKPLIPIGNIPILERIIDKFMKFGVEDFYITVNYKKNLIKAYFSEKQKKCNLYFIEETEPLGTAGSIHLINKRFERPVFVTNCDILIETNYANVLDFHKEYNNDATIVSSLKEVDIPYGVIKAKEQGEIVSMEEKPHLSYFINTGMYVFNSECFNWIPKDQYYDMPSLINEMMKKEKRVAMYPVGEKAFFDMGEFVELKKMEEHIRGGAEN